VHSEGVRWTNAHAATGELVVQEGRVEAGVVSHQCPTAQGRDDAGRNLAEGGSTEDVAGRDAVDVRRPDVALRIDQRGPLVLELTIVGELDNADLDDSIVLLRKQPGRLQVDDGVTRH
jgi:hypothetical protein